MGNAVCVKIKFVVSMMCLVTGDICVLDLHPETSIFLSEILSTLWEAFGEYNEVKYNAVIFSSS
jgi:hypothetical protein